MLNLVKRCVRRVLAIAGYRVMTQAAYHDLLAAAAPAGYHHAIDSGVYIAGVDSSRLDARRPVARETIRDPAVFLIIGQSNAGNHGQSRYAAIEDVFNFNPFDGLCYHASDPLLGATGDDGSPWCRLGDELIRDGFARSILLCPLSVAGATVAEWAPGGPYHHRMTYSVGRLRDAGFWPSHVLWHQGEADALYGTTVEAYMESFRALVQSLRELAITGPIFVATASYFAGPTGHEAGQTRIRAAQRALIDPERSIFAGPDTDTIRDRFDGCHMGAVGLRDHAAAWQMILKNFSRPVPVSTAASAPRTE